MNSKIENGDFDKLTHRFSAVRATNMKIDFLYSVKVANMKQRGKVDHSTFSKWEHEKKSKLPVLFFFTSSR